MNVRICIGCGCLTWLLALTAAAQERVVPIAANSPHVFMSLTDERDKDDSSFFSVPSSLAGGEALPQGGNAHYEVAVFDTGAPATIISRDAYNEFDIRGAGRSGTNITQLGGVGPSIDAVNSDPLGVYAVGFDGLITNPRTGAQTIDRSQLKGSYNDAILYGPADGQIPNLIGTTTSSHYTTIINYSDPRIIEYGGGTRRSPAVSMLPLGSAPTPDRRIGLTIVPGQLGTVPTFLPDLGNLNLDDLGDNPSTPTIAGSFWLRANVKNNDVTRNQLEAIFDTGAQGSFVSEQIAAEMGFDVVLDKPDFVVRIAGVTGVSEEVPGFYADEFTLPSPGGGLVLKNVPLIVFNLTDPRDGVNTLDALIGMNLFTGRDLVLNPEPGNAYLGVSDPSQPFHSWNSQAAEAAWETPSHWQAAGAPTLDWYADVRNVSGSPQVAHVSEDTTIAQMVIAGTGPDATMTVDVAAGKTMQLFGSAILQQHGRLHLNDATLSPIAVELRGGTISGTGTVGGEVLSQGHLAPGGDATGTLRFSGSLDQLSEGTMQIQLGDNTDGELSYDKILVDGAMTLDGELHVLTTDEHQALIAGQSESYEIVKAEQALQKGFEEVTFNGRLLEKRYRIGADSRQFRDHVGEGQFLDVTYPDQHSVVLTLNQAMPGDTNGDGEVQFADFVALSDSFDKAGDWLSGDFNGDQRVDFADFLMMSANYGNTVSPAAAAVPEPGAGCLLLLAFGAVATGRRRRR